MTSPFANALARASRGIDWSRPCLIWLCDYVVEVTGHDPAARWRHYDWTETRAKRAMASAGRFHSGASPVERALREAAKTGGWVETTAPRGPCVGVFNSETVPLGLPAIFDGRDRWLLATADGAVTTKTTPSRMWSLPIAQDTRSAGSRPHDGDRLDVAGTS